jgi:HSP20 family molecular chaperone IbpA
MARHVDLDGNVVSLNGVLTLTLPKKANGRRQRLTVE